MKKFMNTKKKDNKGFSLVELVIVVAIMAILVGILAPQYIKYVERSRKAADASNIDNFATAVKVANADGSYTIPAGIYTISIAEKAAEGKKPTTITAEASVSGGTSPVTTELEAAFKEFVGTNWGDTKLKSTKWGTVAKNISVECTVEANGSVTVKFDPASVADYLGED